jgi:hypothetical protein
MILDTAVQEAMLLALVMVEPVLVHMGMEVTLAVILPVVVALQLVILLVVPELPDLL